ncbi:Lupus La protein [Lamellibrachia satsuma]|nr:Lupus La protein [Lamellibrachia satsuma]
MVEGNEAPVLSALDKKIVKQIEYYFGDMNLPRDNFLREEIKKENGWVCLETMVKFNRLKQLTADYNIITTALKASGTTFIQVSEDNEKIRRNPDLPVPEFNKERNEDLKARSLYAKGFPLDITLDGLIEFFEKFGKVDQIQMRKDAKKSFKGSVFVVFNSKEEGQKFLNAESVKHGETELKRETREGYFKRKEEERKSKKEEQIQKKIQ